MVRSVTQAGLRLREWLTALSPLDALEREHCSRMLALLESADDVFSPEHYVPGHFTASAFILSPERDSLLLILHGKLGRWLQPGGHVEPDDGDVLATARREVLEEVGLNDLALVHAGIFDVDVHVIPARGTMPAHEHFDVRFLFQASNRAARAGSDAKASRWVALPEVQHIESDASVMRAVNKLRARLG